MFERAEDVAVSEFVCRLCVLGAGLDRMEAENKALVVRIDQPDTERKGKETRERQ